MLELATAVRSDEIAERGDPRKSFEGVGKRRAVLQFEEELEQRPWAEAVNFRGQMAKTFAGERLDCHRRSLSGTARGLGT